MAKTVLLFASVAVTVTLIVGVAALLGVSEIPVLGYVLFPGSMAAWLQKGDNFVSSQQFLQHALAFGVPINAVIGAAIGAAVGAFRSASRSRTRQLAEDVE